MMERISTWMAAALGLGCFLGDKDNGSGAIAAGSTKAKVVGESPINELMASMHAVRSVLLLKHILEEPSGATRGDFDTGDDVRGLCTAYPCVGVSAVVTAVNHAEKRG
jgi:hypothetical protein